MFRGLVDSFRNSGHTVAPQHSPVRSQQPDYLGTRDDLSGRSAGSKINAESGNAYITQERPSLELLARLHQENICDRRGNFSLGHGYNSVGISLARNQQIADENHPHAWVAVKTLVSHEHAAKEYANHLALGKDSPHFVNALDVAHVTGDNLSYIFMELMTGGSGKSHLDAVFSASGLTVDDKKELMLDAVNGYITALKAMHDKDRMHGDIDIRNFLHDAESPRIAIADFGSSREATPADKIEEAMNLGFMIKRDIRSAAVKAGVDVTSLDNVIGVLNGQHVHPNVRKNPLGVLLSNWGQIQPETTAGTLPAAAS